MSSTAAKTFSAYSSTNQRVLLVEDNSADARLLLSLFEMERFTGRIDWVKDGVEALDFLFRRKPYESTRLPDLVLLDLNLPKIHGRDVLKSLRANPETQNLSVIVMTTSASDGDMMASYELNAKSFITKPKELTEYEDLVKRIISFDLSLAFARKGNTQTEART